MAELSRLEQIKAERNPLDIIEDIYRQARGETVIDDDHIALLKWYGMYAHREKDSGDDTQYFMKRIKLLGGNVSLQQLKVLAEISRRFARGTADITTRQNIQFHYIRVADLPEVFALLESVGLTSKLAAGDGPRPICGCPVSGIDQNEITDISSTLQEMNAFFEANPERFANLPRKYKIGISGCAQHCVGHEIQDIGFTACIVDGELYYDLTIGGGLSRSQAIAVRTQRLVSPEQVIDVAAVVGDIFRENGNREQRGKARIRHLLADWGIEKFTAEVERRLGYTLRTHQPEPEITPYQKRQHFGIHPQQQDGLSYIGCACVTGKLNSEGLETLITLIEKFGAEGVRFTAGQNFIVYGVPTVKAQRLGDELTLAGFPYQPTPFVGRALSCTSLPYCKFGAVNAKEFILDLTEGLSTTFPGFSASFTIAASGCSHGCSHTAIADIGLSGTTVKNESGEREPGFEIFLGGHLQGETGSRFGVSTGKKLTIEDTTLYIHTLLHAYLADTVAPSIQEFIRAYAEKEQA